MDDGGSTKPKRKVGRMPNLTNMKLVYSDRAPTQYEVEHAKREIERLVLRALSKPGAKLPDPSSPDAHQGPAE